MDNLGHKRQSYERDSLDREDLASDPIQQFAQWYADADQVGITEPNAMALASADLDGKPSVRIVLLKGFGEKGFAFYTNYESRKGKELAENPHAALVFWWGKLQRQIRIEGQIEKLSKEESEKYFRSRPRGSQLSAMASPQSRIVSKEELMTLRDNTEQKFEQEDIIPKPEAWGGYVLIPEKIEFWQGRRNRYHDRFQYCRGEDNSWNINRLAP